MIFTINFLIVFMKNNFYIDCHSVSLSTSARRRSISTCLNSSCVDRSLTLFRRGPTSADAWTISAQRSGATGM